MGVRGLLSFINSRREEYFTPIETSSCMFVIDGNNLRFSLYNSSSVKNSWYGGDYKKYYDFVKSYFERMIECNIEMVVFMDGSFETAKRQTLFERARDQARSSVRCAPGSHNKAIILPMFAKETFLQAIVDLNLRLIQTVSEADHEIAKFAAKSKSEAKACFVVSNDTDFCIYDVDVISLDSTLCAESILQNDCSKSLPCRKFDRAKFLAHFNIGPEKTHLLHLMATLCGNDYVKNSEALDRIFGQIPKMPKGSKKSMNPRHQRMFTLLKWLSKESDIKAALAKLLEAVPKEKRNFIESKLSKSISVYDIEKEECQDVLASGGYNFNEQFQDMYAESKLPHWILDIVIHRLCFLTNQVENFEKKSSHEICLPIIQVCCKILLQSELENTGDPILVKLVFRRGTSSGMTKLLVPPPPLSITNQTFFECLLVSDPNLRKFFASNNSTDCVILSSLVFWLRFDPNEPSRELEASAIIFAFSMAKVPQSCLSKELMEKIYDFGKMNRDPKHRFDIDVVHSLANFQAILYHASLLNKLLGNPYPNPLSMDRWWNGTVLYNLAYGSMCPSETFLRENIAALDEEVLKIYSTIWKIFAENISEFSGLRRKAQKMPRRRKKKHSISSVPETLLEPINRFSVLQAVQ